MDHAIKGGKLIPFQLICQYFQNRKAFLNTSFVTKKFMLHFYQLFWNLLVLDTPKSYSFVFLFIYLFIYFFMLFASMIWFDMNKKPSCILLSKHMYYILTQWQGYFLYSICTFLNQELHQMNKIPPYELWELMVDGKKSVVSG